MTSCPTCGRPLPYVGAGEHLYRIMLRDGVGCYQGQDRLYYLERGLGEVSRAAIDEALAAGLIGPRWDDAPHLEYWKASAGSRERNLGAMDRSGAPHRHLCRDAREVACVIPEARS